MHQWETLARFNPHTSEKVNYQVEPACVGSNDGFDKLTIEIMTNETIILEDALGLGSRFDSEHLNLFTDLTDVKLLM